MELLFPSQKTSMAEKAKASWYIPCIDYLIDKAIIINNKIEVRRNMDAANGLVDKKTYEYVLHPLTGYDNTLNNFPGEIRDVDIITPIREKHIGRYIEIPYTYHVTTNDPDIAFQRAEKLKKEVSKLMQEQFMALVEQQGQAAQQSGKPQEPPDIAKFAKDFMANYIDEKAIQGQKRLELLNDIVDFESKRIQAFYWWWACEEVYTHRWIENGDVRTVVISPLDGFPIDNGEPYVEDMDGFVWRRRITFPQFIDDYRHIVRKEDQDIVEDLFRKYNNSEPLQFPVQLFQTRYENDSLLNYYNTYSNYFGIRTDNPYTNFASPQFMLDCYKVCWKTMKPVKLLKYLDVTTGKEEEREVEMDYKLDKELGDISVTTEWINTVMTAYRFGNRYCGVYTTPEEELVQRRDIKNPSRVKLPFGGKRGVMQGVYINPVPKRVLPYLALYRIYTLQIERHIAKYKANIMLMPQSMINPDDAGSTKDKVYYMAADGTLIYDDTKVDFNTAAQGFRIVGNPGLAEYLKTLYDIRDGIKKDAWELANVNEELAGQTAASQTVTNATRNINAVQRGNNLMIDVFHKMLRRDHIADLEFSKVAWINGKTGSYWNNATRDYEIVSIGEGEGLDVDYGVFVKNSVEEEMKLQEFQKLAFSAAQNGDTELAAQAIISNNSVELAKYVKQHAEAVKAFEASQKEADREAQKYVADKTEAIANAKMEHEKTIVEYKEQQANYRAEIAIDAQPIEDTSNEDNDNERNNELEERRIALQEREQTRKENKDNLDHSIKRDKLSIDRTKANKQSKG